MGKGRVEDRKEVKGRRVEKREEGEGVKAGE